MLDIVVVTIMPEMFGAFAETGVIGGAFKSGKARLRCIDPRDFTADRHRTVDDTPYGGGAGMVLKPEPLAAALDQAKGLLPAAQVYHLSPQGSLFDDARARDMARLDSLILLCGRYQGIDERIVQTRVDHNLSVGDYVVSGGEIPSMLVMDAVLRHVPGVVGCSDSVSQDSFAQGRLAPPSYTRPAQFEGLDVPEVLLSGDHERIAAWRDQQSEERTAAWRRKRKTAD